MRKLIYGMMVSIDGFIEGPHGELDWHVIDEELHQYVNDQQKAVDCYLYGRRMYENMAAFWPTADEDPAYPAYVTEFSRIWKSTPKIVFSRTLQKVEWNARLVRENAAGEVARLKAQPGKDLEVSGANLAATFIRLDLIDEYQLYIHPAVVGSGAPMFPALDKPLALRLVETHPFHSGVVLLRYQRAGKE